MPVLPVNESFPAPHAHRILITHVDGTPITYLDHLASDVKATFTLNGSWEFQCTVPSDNPEVNLPYNANKNVAEGERLLYWFLRYGTTLASGGNEFMKASPGGAWQCVWAGQILNIEDSGDSDAPSTTITAYDGWKNLYHLPVLTDTGFLPGEEKYTAQTGMMPMFAPFNHGGAIAKELINRAYGFYGTAGGIGSLRVKNKIDFGQTGLWTGTMETTPILDGMQFQQGMMVGDAWDELVKTGTCDIVLRPIWDPARPGYTSELSVYNKVGSSRPEALMSWDRWPRSSIAITHETDGLERINYIKYGSGQGGEVQLPFHDDSSRDDYGTSFEVQYITSMLKHNIVDMMAQRELNLKKRGQHNYTVTLAPERSPIPLKEYHLGDVVPVMASRRLRAAVTEELRVMGIEMSVDVDQIPRASSVIVARNMAQVLVSGEGPP